MAFWFKRKSKKTEPPVSEKIKAGLALSGGGAKGYAHLGALKALDEAGIKFDLIAGTSVGSMVGALFSFGLPIDDMIRAASELELDDIRDSTGILSTSNPARLEKLVRSFIGDALFADLKIPFIAVAVDLKTGKEVQLSQGGVAKAVSASCCVPGIFSPVAWDDWQLVDGGLRNVLPTDVLREQGCNRVIGVDINSARTAGTDSLKKFDVLKATMRIALASNAKYGIEKADLVIAPDTAKYRATRKEGWNEMIEAGYAATQAAIPDIKKLLDQGSGIKA